MDVIQIKPLFFDLLIYKWVRKEKESRLTMPAEKYNKEVSIFDLTPSLSLS